MLNVLLSFSDKNTVDFVGCGMAFNARPMTEICDDSIFCLVGFFAEKSISICDNVIGFIRSNVTWKNHCQRLGTW